MTNNLPKLVDNKRRHLLDVFINIAKDYDELSIATGYWDIKGIAEIVKRFPDISKYKKIRLLIGKEPILSRYEKYGIDVKKIEEDYPDKDFFVDMEKLKYDEDLYNAGKLLNTMYREGKLEVQIYKKEFLHAKCYIFGSLTTNSAVGIIGSSNFTLAGLQNNFELNQIENDYRIVQYQPQNENQEHGHLSWYEEVWNNIDNIPWTGEFMDLINYSKNGSIAYSPFEMYMATLWYLYENEVNPKIEITEDIKKNLYPFQIRNANLLINKIEDRGVAMLSDSVGLGKTATSGAVIKYFLRKGARKIYIICPPRLEKQWRDDLANIHDIHQDYEIVSMKNSESIKKFKESDEKNREADLFVIDEAHNLKNVNGKLYLEFLKWFAVNKKSKILLVTATPVNNKLTDFINQIQLASKGALKSFPTPFKTANKTEYIDFFDAVKRLSNEIQRNEKENKDTDWDRVHSTMRYGLRKYLVRSTRKGIIKDFDGGVIDNNGNKKVFPKSEIQSSKYTFTQELDKKIFDIISENKDLVENIDITKINIENIISISQRSIHPIDIINKNKNILNNESQINSFSNLFQLILILGFPIYKYKLYDNRFYGKDTEEIYKYKLNKKDSFLIRSQLSIHNIIRISLLKRSESSCFALRRSLENYSEKLNKFLEYLDSGYLMSLSNIDDFIKEYGEDFDKLEEEKFENEKLDNLNINVESLKKDIQREFNIIKIIIKICEELEKKDDKIISFIKLIQEIRSNIKSKKILIFSFYADTVKYLENNLNKYDDTILDQAYFLTGANTPSEIQEVTGRFSPKSKGYTLKNDEINYLFATDVISEGQNLQDSQVVINFDLHWNPVRMIQRNGRINRLGSEFDNIYVYNLEPADQLEAYINLVKKLKVKINQIAHTIGTDQPILTQDDENPIEYIDDIEEEKEIEDIKNIYNNPNKILEDEDDNELLAEDDYIQDLRKFLENNDIDNSVKNKIKNISLDKWGYMPKENNSKEETSNIIGLNRLEMINKENQTFDYDFFIGYSNLDGKIEPIHTLKALFILRTSITENTRLEDKIKTKDSREYIKKLMQESLSLEVINKNEEYKITPVRAEILDILFSKYNISLKPLLKNIKTKLEKDPLDNVFKSIKDDIKEHNQILPKTLEKVNEIKIMLESNTSEELEIKEKKSLLFYAKQL